MLERLEQCATLLDDLPLAIAIARCQHRAPIRRGVFLPGGQAAVTLSRDRSSCWIDAIEILEHRGDRSAHVVEVQSIESGPAIGRPRLVVQAQPLDECGHIRIAPHPGRKSLEGWLGFDPSGTVPYKAIDRRRVRPVCFDGYDRKSVLFDQMTCDGGTRLVELRGAVS